MRYVSFLLAALFTFFFLSGDDRSPASSVTRKTQYGEYGCKGCKGKNSRMWVRIVFFQNINHVKVKNKNCRKGKSTASC